MSCDPETLGNDPTCTMGIFYSAVNTGIMQSLDAIHVVALPGLMPAVKGNTPIQVPMAWASMDELPGFTSPMYLFQKIDEPIPVARDGAVRSSDAVDVNRDSSRASDPQSPDASPGNDFGSGGDDRLRALDAALLNFDDADSLESLVDDDATGVFFR